MSKIQNIPQAKELIEKYRSITVPMIREVEKSIKCKLNENYFPIVNKITGFGDYRTCTLCVPQDSNYETCHNNLDCGKCIYKVLDGCSGGEQRITYLDIEEATTPKELKKAFRARANHIEKIIEDLEM